MNIFFLDKDHKKCAEYHVDRHNVKIITEANQCMSSAYPKGVAPYKWANYNHPMVKWVRESMGNFLWTLDYTFALCKEYSYRYSNKIHKGEGVANWYKNNPPNLPDLGFTEPPRCFGELKGIIEESDDIVRDYRRYYIKGKSHLFVWKKRNRPEWIES
jgi:hypothetical protein